MNKKEAIELIKNIDTLSINDKIAGQQVDMVIKNQVLDIINQIDEPIEEPLGVLLVDMPKGEAFKYYFLIESAFLDRLHLDFDDDKDSVVQYAYKITEAEAKEKYPNFKWVSLEELEND